MKVKNVSYLGAVESLQLGRIVEAGETVTVTDADAVLMLPQEDTWKPADKAAADLLATMRGN